MKKNLDITNPRFNERIWSVPSDFVESRFHCIEVDFKIGWASGLCSLNRWFFLYQGSVHTFYRNFGRAEEYLSLHDRGLRQIEVPL